MVVLFVGLRPKLILGSNNWPTNTGVTNHHGNVKDHDDNKDGDDDDHDEDRDGDDDDHDEDNGKQTQEWQAIMAMSRIMMITRMTPMRFMMRTKTNRYAQV